MKLPSLPGVVSGVRDRFTSHGSSPARAADVPRPEPDDSPGLPMPLALQGVIELLAVAVMGLLLGTVLLGAVWAAGGFATLGAGGSLQLAGQVWLLAHCVPLTIQAIQGLSLDGGGTVTLVPLGLTLIPFGLAVIAGRRIARACWRGQFLIPFFAGMLAYALFGALVGWLSRTEQVSVDLVAAALLPLVPAGLGTLVGGWSASRSLAAVLGADVASWLQRTSQHSRWAGSYVWAVIRAGFLAAVTAVAAGAMLFVVALAWNWDRVITVYQDLGTGAAGDTALTALQFGYLPNMVVWALTWATGAGFSLGTGTLVSPFQNTLGPLPQFPALAALPTGDPWLYAPAVLGLPVLAGLLAGWWFCREGENHLDDWMAIRLPLRWITFVLSTVLTAVFMAVVGAGLVTALAWLSSGSLGIGRLTDIGPHAWHVFLWLGAELTVGATVGCLVGPWLEREGYRSRSRAEADELPESDSPAPEDDAAVAHHDALPAAGAAHSSRSASGPGAGQDARTAPGGRPGSGADVPDGEVTARGVRGLFRGRASRAAAEPERESQPRGGSTAVGRSADEPGLSRREEAKRRRAQRRSEKRKAARLAALDDERD